MKNKNLLQKVVFAGIAVAILLSTAYANVSAQASPRQEKLLNGLKVLMWSDAKADKVWVKIRVHSGSAFDPQGKEGAMQLLADDLFPNEASRDFFAEDLGGSLEIITTYDYVQINASSKPESYLTMLETLSTALSNPAIDKETTAKVRTALLAKLKVLESDPAYVADQAVAKRLFGAFPYGRPQRGSTASVQKLDFADLIDAKSRFLTADNATITISGNYDKDLAFRALRRYFGSWLKSDKKIPATFRQPDPAPGGIMTADSPDPQMSALRYAIRGVARKDKDFAAASVIASVLNERLKNLVPPQYANDVFVRNEAHTLPGSIVIGFAVKRDVSAQEKGDAGDVVPKALSGPVTDAEFSKAKALFSADWSRRDPATFWLDVDTFQTGGVDPDAKLGDNVTLADANSYLEKIRKSPMAAVLVMIVPKKLQ